MSKTTYLKYKGYLGSIEPQIEEGTLFGKLVFIRDLVTYEADNLTDLTREFQASVNAYLEGCQDVGKEPDKPCKGTFNVRVKPNLHRDAVIAAGDESLNSFVAEAIKEKIERIVAA